ncbi:MAG TPA: LytTR family DNA-binding domain-containing protein [Thermoanaerobaculia bacterium]|jgi:two-component system LytT family response regulator|nr:LytTR family DNA-binding domain-containing protein [Thermoanaerobaculia bacterium]
MPLSTLIVDDEPLAREGLRMLLAEDPDVSAVHEAKDGREAVAAIRRARPDLVFLDVQMPEMDGFSVVEEIGADVMPAVVFVTAHDQYAIDAFEVNAIDYLLKPVTRERFAQALARAKARLPQSPIQPEPEASRQILSLLETLAAPRRQLKRLAVRTAGKTLFVDIGDVDWIEAAENYVRLHVGRASHLVHVAMSTLEKSLDPETFLRIHRSILVNVGRIQELEPSVHGEYVVTLANGVRLRSGRTYHETLKALANNPF